MTRILLVVALILLSGCAEFNRQHTCRLESGHEPYAAAHLFGLAGDLVAHSDPEWQEWNSRRQACVAEKRLAGN
jgi:hypothetical protein